MSFFAPDVRLTRAVSFCTRDCSRCPLRCARGVSIDFDLIRNAALSVEPPSVGTHIGTVECQQYRHSLFIILYMVVISGLVALL